MRTVILLVTPACLAVAVGCVPRLETAGGAEPTVTSDWTLPENGWESPAGGPPATLTEGGFAIGDVPPDMRLPDQFGATVSLWQFYGDVIVLDVSTIWCGPCQDLAETTQETNEEFAGQGFQYVTIIQQDVEGDVPGVEDAVLWAEDFGIQGPVLADDRDPPLSKGVVPDNAFPGVLIIDRDMKIVEKLYAPITDAALHDAIEAAL